MRRKREEGDKSIFIIVYVIMLLITTAYGSIQAGEANSLPPIIKKPSYVYVPEGKPDPFKPFILKETSYKSLSLEELEKLRMLPTVKTELQRVELSKLRIVAMIKTENGILAMVEGPTGKGYVVKPGMGIGTKGGVVDRIVYKEAITPLGKKTVRKIVIKEPFIDKNKKLSFRYIEISMGEKKR